MKTRFIASLSILSALLIAAVFICGKTIMKDREYQQLIDSRYKIYAFDLPAELSFAGEKVPLEDFEVRERLDRELLVNTYFQSNILLIIKRANRYFPVMSPILKANGIPDDFKYLPLIESGFQDMVSQAGAEGPWQILKETGQQYGLEVTDQVDERYNVVRATEAACRYLKDAYNQLGNWTLVAASYNFGVRNVKNTMQKQQEGSYYNLLLNKETSRYVLRIAAVKEIMEHPAVYGLQYKQSQLYRNAVTTTVKVDSNITSLVSFAKAENINYKLLKVFNPWLRSDKLSNPGKKVYEILIPSVKDKATMEVEELSEACAVPLPELKGLSKPAGEHLDNNPTGYIGY